MRLPDPALLVITDRRQAAVALEEVAEAALAAGCRWLSLREKDLDEAAQVALAVALKRRASRWGAVVTLHGSPEAAAAARLDGVHLAAGSDVARARKRLGSQALVGLSVHNAAEAAGVDAGSVDYLVAAPVFETASKPGYGPALGAEGLAAIVAAAPVPVIALGGIEPDSAPACLRAGASGVAVMGGVMRAADPGAAVRALVAALAG